VYCSVLQCVAVCCSMLQRGALCAMVLQRVAVCHSVLRCVAVCQSVLQFDIGKSEVTERQREREKVGRERGQREILHET